MKKGLLTRLDTAFSRDQKEKIYVSHRILENSYELFKWIKEGAVIYLSGNKWKMAVSVRQALEQVIMKEGKLTSPQARNFIEQIKSEKRYFEDVY